MFWKKQKYVDEQFGELEYSGGCWYLEIDTKSLGKFFISFEGDKKSPSETGLNVVREILSKLDSYLEKANSRMETEEVLAFSNNCGDIVFDGFHCREDSSMVDFDFGLTVWDDVSITVHFRNEEVYEVSFSD